MTWTHSAAERIATPALPRADTVLPRRQSRRLARHAGSGSQPAVPATRRTWQGSRFALGVAGLAALATVIGATNPMHSKYVDVFLGPTGFWCVVTLVLLLAAIAAMPLHHLNRLAVALLIGAPLAAGFTAVRPHLAPREQLVLATNRAGLEAVALTDSAGDRVAIGTQQDRSGWQADLTSRRHTLACLRTPDAADELSRLSWTSATTLAIRLFDGRTATLDVDPSGRAVRTSDPQHILDRPGRFGC